MNKDRENHSPALNALLKRISPESIAKTGDQMLISARIDDILKEKGWSKSQFASKIKKEPSVISKWLSGTCNFTLETLTEIRLTLGISLADLVMEKEKPVVFKAEFAVGTMAAVRSEGGDDNIVPGLMEDTYQSNIFPAVADPVTRSFGSDGLIETGASALGEYIWEGSTQYSKFLHEVSSVHQRNLPKKAASLLRFKA